jgi:hypothetical protein
MLHNLYHFSEGVVGPVVDQGFEGSPYAIAVEGKDYKLSISCFTFDMFCLESIQSLYAIQTKNLVDLSVQQVRLIF